MTNHKLQLLFYFVSLLFLSSCVDSISGENSEEVNLPREQYYDSMKDDSDTNHKGETAAKKSEVPKYAEIRGMLINGNSWELEEILGREDETWQRDGWFTYLYYFRAEKSGEVGHVRVVCNMTNIDQIDFFKPGDYIPVGPRQRVKSPTLSIQKENQIVKSEISQKKGISSINARHYFLYETHEEKKEYRKMVNSKNLDPLYSTQFQQDYNYERVNLYSDWLNEESEVVGEVTPDDIIFVLIPRVYNSDRYKVRVNNQEGFLKARLQIETKSSLNLEEARLIKESW
jgi:hypothetical protein